VVDCGSLLSSKQIDDINSYGIFTIGFHAGPTGLPDKGAPGRIYFHGLDYYYEAVSTDTVGLGEWTNIAVVFSSTSCRFYINGEAAGGSNGVFSIPNDPGVTITRIGSWGGDGKGAYLDGRMDEMQISHVTRSDDWMKLNYENQKPNSVLLNF